MPATDTPTTTNPLNIVDLSFLDYEPALRDSVTNLEAEDTDPIFVIAHVCMAELRPLAAAVSDLNVSLMGGGYCNEMVAERVGETILLESDRHLRSNARAHFEYDIADDILLTSSFAAVKNEADGVDESVERVIARWREATEAELSAGLSGRCPERATEIVELAPKSLISGTLATCMTGAIAGLLS